MKSKLLKTIARITNRIQIPRMLHCDHPRIYIDGFRDGAKADYRCEACGQQVPPPGYLDGDYSYIDLQEQPKNP